MPDTSVSIKDVENYVKDPFFKIHGENHLEYFKNLGKLMPDENFLDVGSGAGRMAIPLTSYLKDGKYEGFDIHSEGIEWCKKNISKKFPNFHFQQVDIFNKLYNKGGKILAKDFKFPFLDETFHFVNLTSVFTHMVPKDLENYFSEISRVLKKNGRCFISYFLLNEESIGNIKNKLSTINFEFEFEGYRSNDKKYPEQAIAYDEKYIVNLYKKNNLEILGSIHYGNWSGRKNTNFGQDVIIAIKN